MKLATKKVKKINTNKHEQTKKKQKKNLQFFFQLYFYNVTWFGSGHVCNKNSSKNKIEGGSHSYLSFYTN